MVWCAWSIIISISLLPLWNVSHGMQITSCLSWFLVQISPSWMPNLGWDSGCVIIFAHIMSLRYVFLTMAHKSIVSSTWVHRDLPSLLAAMVVTSSVNDVSSDGSDFCHPRLESQPWCDKILVFQQGTLITLLLLHIIPCSSQLAVIRHLGLALCLHWHRCFPSDYHHSCHFHSSEIGNLLLYCLCHWCAWWCSWSGRGILTIRLVCPIGSFGSRSIWDAYGQLLGWICTLVACLPTS